MPEGATDPRARLSRVALARLGGVSESTIKNIERGRDISLPTIKSILSVRELGLAQELGAELCAPFGLDSRHPNAWYAPGFAPVSEFRKMLRSLQGQGGSIEQTHLYFDHASAADR